jgi:hypothetical protein
MVNLVVPVTPSVEQWFQVKAQSLKLLAPQLERSIVKQVLHQYLEGRVLRLSRHIEQPEDASNWLKIILKSSDLIRLWPSPHQPITIAVDCSSNLKLAQEQLALIQSPEFSATRKALGIDRHWFLIIRDFPLQKPQKSELLDALYGQLDNDEECAIALL